jgi:hypothetical protein
MKVWVRRHPSGSWEVVRDGTVVAVCPSRLHARIKRQELLEARHGKEDESDAAAAD